MTDESVSSILALSQLVSLAIFNTGLTERGQVEQSCHGSDEDLRKADINRWRSWRGSPCLKSCLVGTSCATPWSGSMRRILNGVPGFSSWSHNNYTIISHQGFVWASASSGQARIISSTTPNSSSWFRLFARTSERCCLCFGE